jgi:hypothetical protein
LTETSQAIVPYSGEIISLDDPPACLKMLVEIRELEGQLKDLKSDLSDALKLEFSRQGTKTLDINGIKATLGADSEIVWDVGILDELRDLGLPEARMDALVTAEVRYTVNASVAKQLAGANPQYAEVIERAKSRVPKKAYVGVKRG